jgi:dTDP-4-dehydrorhamnose 3,5-epimerase
VELSAANQRALFIPEGVAHGFLTLEDDTDVLYQIDRIFEPGHGQGVRWNDPAFAIAWPAEPRVISERDATYPDHPPRG